MRPRDSLHAISGLVLPPLFSGPAEQPFVPFPAYVLAPSRTCFRHLGHFTCVIEPGSPILPNFFAGGSGLHVHRDRGAGAYPTPRMRSRSRQPSSKPPVKSTICICERVQDRSSRERRRYIRGAILPAKRSCRSEYRSSLSAHFDSTAQGERRRTNQSQRRSAAPIPSCHCCAPCTLVSPYQTGIPWRRRTSTSFLTNGRSRLEWDRKTSFGTRDSERGAGSGVAADGGLRRLHDPRIEPQPTASPRIGYALRFMPATSHYDHHDLPIPDSRDSAHHTRPLIQVRGRDVSGRNDFTIGHPRAGGGESGPPAARTPGEPYASRVRASGRGSGRAADG